MGSEGPPGVIIHVTGFKKFHGVPDNPTEVIVSRLRDYVEKQGMLDGKTLGTCTVLETAGQAASETLHRIIDSSLPSNDGDPVADLNLLSDSNHAERIIWLHFGVNSGATKFAIEHRAVNEATFRCPDEMGWQPQRIPIIPEDGDISHAKETTLPVANIVQALVKKGYDVAFSGDAGRFVCNYIYYLSLHYAAIHGFNSLFVHVPLFAKIDEETQLQFVASLLEHLEEVDHNSSRLPVGGH